MDPPTRLWLCCSYHLFFFGRGEESWCSLYRLQMRILTLAVFPSIIGMQPIRSRATDHICGQFIVTNVWGVAIGMALLWSGIVLPWNGELGIEGYPWTQIYGCFV